MKLCEGFTLVELTDDKIVQEKKIGETGRLRMFGNPNPPPEEHQKVIDEIITDFDAIEIDETVKKPKVGVVGERNQAQCPLQVFLYL